MLETISEISHKSNTSKSNRSHGSCNGRSWLGSVPLAWPAHIVFVSFRFVFCAVSATFLISYIGDLGAKGSCGGAGTKAITINYEAAAVAAPSRFALVSSDVLLPSLVEKKSSVYFLVFFSLQSPPYPFGIFAPLTWIAFWGNYVYPAYRSFNVL